MTQLSLFKTRRFYPLFLTQFLGAFNDNFLKNALVILITFKGTAVLGLKPAELVAVSGGIFILPFFLFSATAGQLADKLEKSRLIRWIKLAEIAIMVVAATGFMCHHYELLLFSLFLMGLHSTVFGPIKYSILPQHLGARELVGGNALVEAGTFLAILFGTIAGGVLIGIEPRGTFVVSAGLIIVAFLGWVTSRGIPDAPPVDPTLKIHWNPITPTWQIIQTARQTRSVFLSILGVSWFWFFGAIILSLFPTYCKDLLHANEHVVTLFLATFSVGIAIGSLCCERLSRRHLELGIVPLGSLGMSWFAADLFFVGVPQFVVGQADAAVTVTAFFQNTAGLRILGDLFMLSVFSGLFIVPLYTLIQKRSAPQFRSRIIAANNIINALFMVAASGVLVGLMHLGLSIPQIFLVLAVTNAVVATYIYTVLPEFTLRFIMWCLANVLYRMRVKGHDQIPEEGPAVLVCNHVSFIDWMIIAAGVARPVRFIMDHSFAKGAIMKTLVKQAKIIPIASAKENPELLQAAFDRAAAELRAGELVCIFPEGKITHDGNLNVFKPGVERIIRETPVPVVPMALNNLWGSFFSRQGGKALLKRPRRFWSRIGLTIGTPIPASEVSAQKLFDEVSKLNAG
jgi:1-acyl-sn-glycerol-3-phosphate acyltransferase